MKKKESAEKGKKKKEVKMAPRKGFLKGSDRRTAKGARKTKEIEKGRASKTSAAPRGRKKKEAKAQEEVSPAHRLALLCAELALDKKCIDPVIIDLRSFDSFTKFFVIVSGRSDRHVQGIVDNIEEVLHTKGIRPIGIEGREAGQWVLMDYVDVITHVFYAPVRELYALESLWSDAPRVDITNLTAAETLYEQSRGEFKGSSVRTVGAMRSGSIKYKSGLSES